MEVTVVTRKTADGYMEVFGVYKTPQAAKSAIRVHLMHQLYTGADVKDSIGDFDETQTDVED